MTGFRGGDSYMCGLTVYYTILYYAILYCTALHYTTLQYTTLHYTALHHTALHYTTLHYAIPCPIINTNATVLAFYLMLLAYASPGARAAAPVTAAPARRFRPRTPCHPAPGRIASPSWFAPRFVIMVCPNLRLKGASYVGPLFYSYFYL